MVQYRSIKIPEDLYTRIERTISKAGLGYRTISEFIIDAIRRRVEELEKVEEVVEG